MVSYFCLTESYSGCLQIQNALYFYLMRSLEYNFTGYQVPVIPRASRSARVNNCYHSKLPIDLFLQGNGQYLIL